jgi:hypothetical protein
MANGRTSTFAPWAKVGQALARSDLPSPFARGVAGKGGSATNRGKQNAD